MIKVSFQVGESIPRPECIFVHFFAGKPRNKGEELIEVAMWSKSEVKNKRLEH